MKKIISCAAVVGLLVASSSSVFARGGVNNGGANASQSNPAYVSQNPASTNLKPAGGLSGPAAYAPGQQMRDPTSTGGAASAPGNGAAVYAPGFLK